MSLLKNWSNDEYNALEKGVILANHTLPETGLFTDEGLAGLIDNHPDEDITIATMGDDPSKFEWIEGERDGATGQQIVELVHAGKLWVSMRNTLAHHTALKEVVNQLYDCLLYTSPSPRDKRQSRMPSSA